MTVKTNRVVFQVELDLGVSFPEERRDAMVAEMQQVLENLPYIRHLHTEINA
jgi:hypothetical protein